MKIDFIPFQLGMQYENWEFDLDPMDKHLQYDKYKYIKNDFAHVFGLKVKEIWLYFNLDILFHVELIFDSREPIQAFIQLTNALVNKYGKKELLSDENLNNIYVKWSDSKNVLILKYSFRTNIVGLDLIDLKFQSESL